MTPGGIVIWDFNGTLLDDVECGIKSINVLLSRRGLPTVKSQEQYRSLFRFPIIKYYESLGFDFTREDFSSVAVEWVEQYDIFSKESKIHPDALAAIEALERAGIRQVLLSATEQKMLERQVAGLGLDGRFEEVLGMDTVEAHTKLPAALRFTQKARPTRVVFVGDTLHDAEVAAEAGAECLLIACGHQSRERLMTSGLPVFDTHADAVRYIIEM